MSNETNSQNEKEKMFKKYGIATLLIFEIIAFVLVGAFVGGFIEKKLSMGGLGLAGGVIVGFIIGFYKFYVDAKRFLK